MNHRFFTIDLCEDVMCYVKVIEIITFNLRHCLPQEYVTSIVESFKYFGQCTFNCYGFITLDFILAKNYRYKCLVVLKKYPCDIKKRYNTMCIIVFPLYTQDTNYILNLSLHYCCQCCYYKFSPIYFMLRFIIKQHTAKM